MYLFLPNVFIVFIFFLFEFGGLRLYKYINTLNTGSANLQPLKLLDSRTAHRLHPPRHALQPILEPGGLNAPARTRARTARRILCIYRVTH